MNGEYVVNVDIGSNSGDTVVNRKQPHEQSNFIHRFFGWVEESLHIEPVTTPIDVNPFRLPAAASSLCEYSEKISKITPDEFCQKSVDSRADMKNRTFCCRDDANDQEDAPQVVNRPAINVNRTTSFIDFNLDMTNQKSLSGEISIAHIHNDTPIPKKHHSFCYCEKCVNVPFAAMPKQPTLRDAKNDIHCIYLRLHAKTLHDLLQSGKLLPIATVSITVDFGPLLKMTHDIFLPLLLSAALSGKREIILWKRYIAPTCISIDTPEIETYEPKMSFQCRSLCKEDQEISVDFINMNKKRMSAQDFFALPCFQLCFDFMWFTPSVFLKK